jgi:hypothetical protein
MHDVITPQAVKLLLDVFTAVWLAGWLYERHVF